MKAWIRILLVGLLLVSFYGCGNVQIKEENLSNQMTDVITQAINNSIYPSQNNHKDLFSYYLPFNVGKKETTDVSSILSIEGYDVVMNLNVSAVITDKYYSTSTYNTSESLGTVELSNTIFSNSGFYKDYEKKEQKYSYYITKATDDSYLVLLKTKYFTYLTNVPLELLPLVTDQLFAIARSTRINAEKIVTVYSKKEQIKFEQKIVQIYQEQVPVNGALSEMIYGNNSDDTDWNVDELDYYDEWKKDSESTYVEWDGEESDHDVQTNKDPDEEQEEREE